MSARIDALDAAFVLAVTGAAMLLPALALVVGGAWLAVVVVLSERRAAG